ncbi:MAG: hypothetical protein IH984_06625 [Planctomycetes bacterium]|nr:hypothetical protein [Planctomycetota bacterium]
MSNSQLENLVSHVVDGDASSDQWNELNELAENNPLVWRELANTLRDHQSFSRGVNATVAAADNIPLPENIVEPSFDLAPEDPVLRPRRVGHWGGWAVAAMIALAWVGGINLTGTTGNGLNTGLNLSAAEYLDKYKEQGKKEGLVYDELPEKIFLDSKEAESGKGFDILYVRLIVEKTVVPNLYHLGSEDENGSPVLVRVTDLANRAIRNNNQ